MSKSGFVTTGLAGLAGLGDYSIGQRTLKLQSPPMKGDDVKFVQKALGLKPTGIYDRMTAAQVRLLQKKSGFEVTSGYSVNGKVEKPTWRAIKAEAYDKSYIDPKKQTGNGKSVKDEPNLRRLNWTTHSNVKKPTDVIKFAQYVLGLAPTGRKDDLNSGIEHINSKFHTLNRYDDVSSYLNARTWDIIKAKAFDEKFYMPNWKVKGQASTSSTSKHASDHTKQPSQQSQSNKTTNQPSSTGSNASDFISSHKWWILGAAGVGLLGVIGVSSAKSSNPQTANS